LPAVTKLRTWVANSLQTGDLGVFEGSCESDHARHVFAILGEVVTSQAEGTWKQTHFERFQKCDRALISHIPESRHTHLSEDTLLCLRPSQSAVMPSVVNVPKEGPDTPQSTLSSKLPGTNHERFQK
jgi:hypothetical protein